MIELIARINDVLSQGRPVVAATIVTNEGSTPRTAGSKMLIFEDGSIAAPWAAACPKAKSWPRPRKSTPRARPSSWTST